MKEIQSAGGPLIGLDRDHLSLWTGVFGKKFIGEASSFTSDYDAACHSEHPSTGLRGNTSEIKGLAAHGILINNPDYTAVLQIDRDAVYIAQIEACEPEWGLDLVKRVDFDAARFNPKHNIYFSCKSCIYVLFDAAYAFYNINDDYLTFELEEGRYVFSNAMYKPDSKTDLILYRITKD